MQKIRRRRHHSKAAKCDPACFKKISSVHIKLPQKCRLLPTLFRRLSQANGQILFPVIPDQFSFSPSTFSENPQKSLFLSHPTRVRMGQAGTKIGVFAHFCAMAKLARLAQGGANIGVFGIFGS
jgi:hypothetical protein